MKIARIALLILLGLAVSGPVPAGGSAAAGGGCHTFQDYTDLDNFWSNWFGFRDDRYHVLWPASAEDLRPGGEWRDDGTVEADGRDHDYMVERHTLETGEHKGCGASQT